jgi:hypothetical protein
MACMSPLAAFSMRVACDFAEFFQVLPGSSEFHVQGLAKELIALLATQGSTQSAVPALFSQSTNGRGSNAFLTANTAANSRLLLHKVQVGHIFGGHCHCQCPPPGRDYPLRNLTGNNLLQQSQSVASR